MGRQRPVPLDHGNSSLLSQWVCFLTKRAPPPWTRHVRRLILPLKLSSGLFVLALFLSFCFSLTSFTHRLAQTQGTQITITSSPHGPTDSGLETVSFRWSIFSMECTHFFGRQSQFSSKFVILPVVLPPCRDGVVVVDFFANLEMRLQEVAKVVGSPSCSYSPDMQNLQDLEPHSCGAQVALICAT